LDYHVVSERLMPKVTRTDILTEEYGSDHCPVLIELEG
jgi:exodeoxyribonuclease-3